MKLYSYWHSSAAYRVRIALHHKGVEYELVPVNLLASEHKAEDYLRVNPVGLVPALELDDGRHLTQSTAILHWLESRYPEPALLPEDPFEQARVLGWAQTVACEIHPLNNVAVLNFLKAELSVAPDSVNTTWYYHWLERGLDALEAEIVAAPYCHGAALTLADLYLVPQLYNARRFKFDLQAYPKLLSVWDACNALPAFQDALPQNQPDAQ
jgi:maleylacetoacetate isomerase